MPHWCGRKVQDTRKGMPLLYTAYASRFVYSRGGACPRPGTSLILLKVRASGGIPLQVPWWVTSNIKFGMMHT
jgi:hypothetical protein